MVNCQQSHCCTSSIEFAFRSFCGELKDSRVKWFTDNGAAAKDSRGWEYEVRFTMFCFAYFPNLPCV